MLRIFPLLLLVVLLPVSLQAVPIILTMDSNWSNYHSYSYTDTNGIGRAEYTGPYSAKLSGGSYGTGTQVYINCFDINVHVYIGGVYEGYMSVPTTPADLAAAYLESKMLQAGGFNAPVSVTGPLAMAIWQLENPSSINPTPFPYDRAAAALILEAQNAVASGAWTFAQAKYYPMWMPTPLGSAQRFGLVLGPEPELTDLVPEPQSLLMIAGGLLLIAIAGWKRVHVQRQPAVAVKARTPLVE